MRACVLGGVVFACSASVGFGILAYDTYQQNEYRRFMSIDKEKYLVLERADENNNVTRTVLPRKDFCEEYCRNN